MSRRLSTPLRIFKNFAVRFVGRILSIVISLVVMAMLGRYLGEAGYGDYAFWYNLIFLLQLFGDLGLQVIVVREIARDRENISTYFGDAILLKLMLSVVFILGVGGAAFFIIPEASVSVLLVVSVAALFGSSQDISIWIFRGIEAMEYEALLMILSQIFWLACIWFFINNQFGLAWMIAAQMIANILRMTLGISIVLAMGIKPSFRFHWPRFKLLLLAALPVGVTLMVSVLHSYTNIALLKWLARPEDISSFNVGMVVTSGFLFLSITLTTSFFPVFARYVKEQDPRLPSFYTQVSKYLVIISAPVSIGLFLLAHQVVELMFKSGFTDSVLALQVLSVTLIFRFFNRMYRFVFPASDSQMRSLRHEIAGILTNLTLALVLISKFQFLGACFAFVGGESLLFLLNYRFMAKLIAPLPFFKVVGRPLAASAAMGVVVWVLRDAHVAVVLVAAGVAYPAALFLFRVLSVKEMQFIREVARLGKSIKKEAKGTADNE